jgi:hypothetical protein
MIETISRLLRIPYVQKYRKILFMVALALLGLHLAAIVLPFFFKNEAWVNPLTDNSGHLLGFTGALVLLVVLDRAILAMSDVEKRQQREVYSFIKTRLIEWFSEDKKSRDSNFMKDVIDDHSYTDFKVTGHPGLIDVIERNLADEFCRMVHFEFTFYPTKLIYGIHFESPSGSVNEAVCKEVERRLMIDEETGFVRDREIPKRPGWIFLIRTVEVKGGLEASQPAIMTHARHFVELIGHGYKFLYCNEVAAKYAGTLAAAPSR